jgi:hypothetical protein
MNNIEIRRPWYVALIAARPERAKVSTALEDALLSAVERALYDPRHRLHRQTFGFYGVPESRRRDRRG